MKTKPEMYATDFVQDHLKNALNFGAQEWFDTMRAILPRNIEHGHFESPLEMAFYAWYRVLASVRGIDTLDLKAQQEVCVSGQWYRVDFEVIERDEWPREQAANLGLTAPRIAIELDGHEFHERTKDQVARRDQRDRTLQVNGWHVFHISGSVFHADPETCVYNALLDATGVFWQFRRQLSGLTVGA